MSLSASQLPLVNCGVCFNAYNSNTNVPKLLPCAHTVCSYCIPHFQQLKCPDCRKPIPHKVQANYPTNYVVIGANEERSKTTQTITATASSALSSSVPTPSPSPVSALSSNQPSSETLASLPAYPNPTASIESLLSGLNLSSSSASQAPTNSNDLSLSAQPAAQMSTAPAQGDDYRLLRNQPAAQSNNPYGSLSAQPAAQMSTAPAQGDDYRLLKNQPAAQSRVHYGSLSAQPAAQMSTAPAQGDDYRLLKNQPAAQSRVHYGSLSAQPAAQSSSISPAAQSNNPYGSLSAQPVAQSRVHYGSLSAQPAAQSSSISPAPQSINPYGSLGNQPAAQPSPAPQVAPSLFASQSFQPMRPMGDAQVMTHFAMLSRYYTNPEEAKRIRLNQSINGLCVYEDKFTTDECLQALNEYPIGNFIACVTNNPGFTEQQLQSLFYFKIVYKNNLGACVCRYITYDKNDLRVKLYKKEGSVLVQDRTEFPSYLGDDPASAFKLNGLFWKNHLFPRIFEHLKSGQF